MQYDKTVIPCLHNILYDIKDQEKSQEVRLADDMPDIGRVITGWGQLLVRSKQWGNGSVGVNCGVLGWMMYEPEGGGVPQCVEVWVPFQCNWDIEMTDVDGVVSFQPLVKFIDARSVSARKLSVRVGISVFAMAAIPNEVTTICPSNIDEDIHVLKQEYIVKVPQEMGEKDFSLEESVELGQDLPGVSKIVSYTLQPTVSEYKIMGDKLILRGLASLHLVYLSENGSVHSWDFGFPYSQYAQLDREYSANADAKIIPIVTSLELEYDNAQKLCCKFSISGQYTVYERVNISVISDAYSNARNIKSQFEALTLPSVLAEETVNLTAEQRLDFDGIKGADLVFYPEHAKVYSDNERVEIELTGMFRFLGYNNSGQLTCVSKRWEHRRSLDADRTVKQLSRIVPGVEILSVFTVDGMIARSQLPVELTSISGTPIPMLVDISAGEMKQIPAERPSLLIKRVGDLSLWEHAKASGSTVEAIMTANGLSDEPVGDQMLLIPIL